MSLEQPDIYFVLTQFRSSYPSGALLTELLQVHQDKYLVKATVQIDGVPLATGMASASVLELAEDQARIRALGVLGIYPLPKTPTDFRSSLPPQHASRSEASFHDWAPTLDLPTGEGAASSLERASTFSASSTSSLQSPGQDHGPEKHLEPFQASLEKGQRSTLKPKTKSIKPDGSEPEPSFVTKTGAYSFGAMSQVQPEPDELAGKLTPVAASGPIDLSDVIAQTSIEVERLGWTPEQGKQYLKQAYGKESRQLLTPEELMSFLSYLKSQQP